MNMKAPQGVLVLGWTILCSTMVFLFNEQLRYQFPIQPVNAPKIIKPININGQRRQNYSRVVTEIDLESSILTTSNPETLNCKRMNLKLDDKQRSIVASLGNGRLGNQMDNFASCYAVMKEYGMYPYLNTMQLELLERVFVLPELVESDNASYYMWEQECIEGKSIPWKGMSDEELFRSRGQLEKLRTNSYVKLGPYTTDIQGFFPYAEELKNSVFKFKTDDMRIAKTIFQSVKNTYRATNKHNIVGDITMISMHIRLTDFKHHLSVLFNMTYISNEFLTQAMTYCKNKYENVLFFALSDDIPSAKQKLLIKENDEFDIVFPGVGDISSPAIDMALLSLSDHSILSYGSFGLWGALLANRLQTGETIMAKDFQKTDVGEKVQVAIEKHNSKNWIFL